MGSEEELMYYVRIHAEWNEDSFYKMKQLARDVMKDYLEEDFYPKRLISYFMIEIPSVIHMLSYFKKCTEKELLAGYTDESYQAMIAERIEQLKKFRWEFIDSLGDWK